MHRNVAAVFLLTFGLAAWGCAGSEPAATNDAAPAAPAEPALTAEQAVQTTETGTEVTLYVTKDGFVPANVRVPAGKPVTLKVTRKTEGTCATELVMPAHGIDQPLPLDQVVTVSFTPDEAGVLTYACGMDMIKGTVTVD
jgi:plastocyanin domain-containing protein